MFTDLTPETPPFLFSGNSIHTQNIIGLLNQNLFSTTTIYNSIINESMIDGLSYQYKYDLNNRLAEKKLPGKQWEFIVYDKLDRPVATGPAFSPYGSSTEVGWLITKYDAFNRVVYTGWMQQEVINRKELQEDINNSTIPLYESKTSSPNNINNIQVNYTNQAFPTSGFELLTVNYYDNYDFSGAPNSIPLQINGRDILINAKTLPTGTWNRFLNNSGETLGETSYVIYDYIGRPVINHTANYLGGFTNILSIVDFEGKTLETTTIHKRDNASMEVSIVDKYTYSPQSKLIKHLQTVNNNPEELIVFNQYDELGQLISKNVGGQVTDGSIGHQKVDFKYNIRGWLKEINDVKDLTSSIGSTIDMFAFKINYNTVTITNNESQDIEEVSDSYNHTVKELYNGNIAETYWRSSSDNIVRKYSYSYDDLNRLKKAYYQKPLQTIEQTNSYNETLEYDKNGNITELNRTGSSDGPNGMVIDKLTYFYQEKTNVLLQVTDLSNMSQGFKDDSDGYNDQNEDYKYDENGNLTADENKGIDLITYNHLNLPTLIKFGNGNQINYFYNATGNKLKKIVYDNTIYGGEIKTDYLGGYQYLNEKLQFFPHAEGYVNYTEGYFNHVYNFTDHLGNIRLSYTFDFVDQVLKILEENHYYPFGLKHDNYNSNNNHFEQEDNALTLSGKILKIKPVPPAKKLFLYKYKYNGKEWQDELGLNFYDFGFRNYDPAIGRWMNIDPYAERRYELTTYNYVQNSPMFRFDPNGLTDFTLNKKTGDVKLIGKPNNEPDRILKTNSKGEVKKKGEGFLGFLVSKSEKGKDKVAIEGIQKGILKDGQNFKEKGAAYKIGGEGNPTKVGIESFAVKLSNYLGLEVGGVYASENNSGVITHMTIGKYKGNDSTHMEGGLGQALLTDFYNVNQNQTSLIGHFHVHPGGTRNPSPTDDETKDSWKYKYKSSIFNILINDYNNKNGYESIPY